MQLSITQIHTTPQTITITKKEYNELKHKANKYDTLTATHTAHITAYNNTLTAEQRKENARKAALVRWGKPRTHEDTQKDIIDSIENLYKEPTIYED